MAAAFTVSGPGFEPRPVESAGVGTSLAITVATRLDEAGTVYVKNAEGYAVVRVERDSDGNLDIFSNGKEAS